MNGRATTAGLVVLCAGMPWDGPAMSEKHLAQALMHHAPILYVDPARSVLRGARRARMRTVDPRLSVLSPVAPPGPSRPVVRDLARRALRRTVTRAAVGLAGPGGVHATIVASLDHLSGDAGERLQVLWGTDDWVSGAELLHQSPVWLRRQERRQLDRVDRILAVSDVLAERWRAAGHEVDVVPNGCDVDGLAGVDTAPVPAAVRHLTGPVAGVVGHLSRRIDLALLDAVAAAGITLLLVGSHDPSDPDMARLLARPNVVAVGAVPSHELPGYLRVMSVGLTPYADSAFNRASFPLKTLEYLAAGRRVVSTDLPATRALGTNLIDVATGADAFVARTREALETPWSDGERATRRAFARQHSWAARADVVAGLLGLPAGDQTWPLVDQRSRA